MPPSKIDPKLQQQLTQLMNRQSLAGTVDDLRQLSGGANQETWAFRLQTPAGDQSLILRRSRSEVRQSDDPGANILSPMALEATLLEHAAAAGVPVPKVLAILQPDDGMGDGFIMNLIPGETLGGRIVRNPEFTAARKVLAYQCGKTLAAIHSMDVASLPSLPEIDAPNTLDTYLLRHRSSGFDRPVFELAFQWLRGNMPVTTAEPTLVHGDFRNGNLIVGETGLRAVLDWELAHLGDPMEDLGWLCVNSWRFGKTDLPVGGFGHREDLFSGYEAGGGHVDPDRVRFWEVMGCLKWGVMCQGMARSPGDGSPRTIERAAIGRRTSETEIDLLNLLAPLEGVR
ncbi:phosphotransferase family protein [Marinobacter salinexigens]|nr:phosphotransferase family protein [Marinobacter salinexigens]